MQVNFRKALLDAAHHLLVPVDFQIGMQSTLHQHARPAQFDGLANLVVNGLEIEDVSLFSLRPLQWSIKSAEGAVLGAVVRVINIAVNDVRDHALRMEPATHRIGLHADAH